MAPATRLLALLLFATAPSGLAGPARPAHTLCSLLARRRGALCVVAPRSVGIDLGTTYSLVSVVEDGKPVILPVDGQRLTPSVVHYASDGEVLVGSPALALQASDPQYTFSSVKRLAGRTIGESRASGDHAFFRKQLQAVRREGSTEEWCALRGRGGQALTPEEVLSQVVAKLLASAHKHCGGPIDNAVVTVPAYFGERQQQAIERAALLAGLRRVRLLKEPEAAALAYGLTTLQSQLVIVADLGGGTFDVSVLEVGGGFVEVIATGGDAHLGGDDFDAAVADWALRALTKEVPQEVLDKVRGCVVTRRALLDRACAAKIVLSAQREASIDLQGLWVLAEQQGLLRAGQARELPVGPLVLTRRVFQQQVEGLLQRLMRPIREVALMAGINLPGDSGLLVAGFSDAVEEPEGPLSLESLRAAQTAGRGAARARRNVEGAARKGARRLQQQTGAAVALFPGGVGVDEVLLVGGATRMPCVATAVRSLLGVEPQRSVHPDEAVCLGAGQWAGVLDGTVPRMEVVSAWQAALLRAMQEARGSPHVDVGRSEASAG